MKNLIFVHGWGLDQEFWAPLLPYFEGYKTTCLNLGYQGKSRGQAEQGIYITHSLGTMWVLGNTSEKMQGLIVINGFHTFNDFADKRALRAMKLRLEKEPEAQMREFFTVAGIEAVTENLNVGELRDGLDLLSEGQCHNALKALMAPVLFLAGAKDPIVPLPASKKQSLGYPLEICENGGHALPQTHTAWCAEKIKEYLEQ